LQLPQRPALTLGQVYLHGDKFSTFQRLLSPLTSR